MKIVFLLTVMVSLTFTISIDASDPQIKDVSKVGNKKTGFHNKNGPRSHPLLLNYRAPMRGKPVNRVGGGTRGLEGRIPFLVALVPNHPGLTIQSQPILYWYFSGHIPCKIEFTLIDEQTIEPIVQERLNIPDPSCMTGIRLSDFGIHLIQDVDYQWFVAAVSDPDQRSKDIVASGRIMRVEPSKNLMNKLNQANKMDIPGIYAEEGLWYDALSAISALIDADPNNKKLPETRKDLLKQVGLSGFLE